MSCLHRMCISCLHPRCKHGRLASPIISTQSVPLICPFICVGDLAEHGPIQRSPRAVRQRAGGVRRHATWTQRLRALPRVPGTTSHHIRPKHRGVETYSSSFSSIDSVGVFLFRVLQVEVPPPKVTFCSPACVHEHRLRTSGTYVRQCLRVRETNQNTLTPFRIVTLYRAATAGSDFLRPCRGVPTGEGQGRVCAVRAGHGATVQAGRAPL